jgi:UDP-N-acetylglucosamine:LPS N-acetylglucosamine transferase
MQKKPVIALFTSTQGHSSIAQAIKEVLEPEYSVATYFKRDPLMNAYVLLYQFFPGGYKVPFLITQGKPARKFLQPLYLNRYWEDIEEFCVKTKPDLNISTFLGFNPAIEKFSEENKIPFLNVITDPRTIHTLLFSYVANTNYVFDKQAEEFSAAVDPEIHSKASGWFVRKEFEEAYDVDQIRTQLKLKKQILTFLLASGSEGTNFITTILPSLVGTTTPLQLIISCGSNKSLYRSMKFLQKVLKKTKSKLIITPVGFTNKLHLFMQASDLVIGKAGPNTLFESVATRTPFFAITHISGQEDGNLDLIKEHKLGYVEENPFKAGKLLQKIQANPKQLKQFKASLEKMAQYNIAAKQLLLSDVRRQLG